MANVTFFECSDKVIPSALLLLPLLELCQQQGVDTSKVLNGSKLAYYNLLKSDINISFDQLAVCCHNSFNLLPHNDFSFQIGQQFFNQYNSEIKTAIINARNLTHVFKLLRCFSSEFFPVCKFSEFNSEQQRHFVIDVGIKHCTERVERFFYETLISIVCHFIDWRFPEIDITIQLPFKAPKHLEYYHTFIKHPVIFDKPLLLISIKSEQLDIPAKDSSTILRRQAFYKLTKKQKLNSLLTVLARHIAFKPNTTLETAAAHLSMSPATLKRKLQAHNTSFKYEKDQVLKNVTLFHLMQTSASNQTISEKLAINDLTNFRRLLKRLTGKTPNQLRLAK
ncbi:hypothetical protein CWC15_17465 [Pseudoalteromonas spongiae]|nr:hypothetical protein CWC15_17465 [Pseudoalteromonas spongiae]